MKIIFGVLKNPLFQICIAFFMGWFFYFLGQKEPLPSYAIEEYQMFADIKEDVPELKLIWNGKPINNFYSTRIVIWNSGDDYIDFSRLIPTDPIRIVTPPSIKLLNFKLTGKSRDNMGISVVSETFDEKPIIKIVLKDGEAIEPNDGIAIKIYFTSEEPSEFIVKGRVKGVPSGFIKREWKQVYSNSKLNWVIWIVFIIAVLTAFDLLKEIYFEVKERNYRNAFNQIPKFFTMGATIYSFLYYIIFPRLFGIIWLG